MRLYVKDGSIPTVRGKDTEGTATKSALAAVVHHVACQTEPPVTRRVGTQLSMQTLHRNFESSGTPVFHRLEKVLTNEKVLKEVQKLSPHYWTSSLEAFHNIILCFAPKNVFFPFIGMLCRLYLAALHFNENAPSSNISSQGSHYTSEKKKTKLLSWKICRAVLTTPQVLPNPGTYLDEVLKITASQDLSSQFDQLDPQEVT
ncbi:uncharacterized protein LOC133498617 [Syngnathoides biaculeatus]|uniref:uncharacterized protein LOC133498617 n=1 Tax=Syngnathoides biaculeatus TaxID=300417 RepID=UPI002ADDF7B0|nr:uncharacterized protein LOC133498617 [Syngnathoides biaculeatus]